MLKFYMSYYNSYNGYTPLESAEIIYEYWTSLTNTVNDLRNRIIAQELHSYAVDSTLEALCAQYDITYMH